MYLFRQPNRISHKNLFNKLNFQFNVSVKILLSSGLKKTYGISTFYRRLWSEGPSVKIVYLVNLFRDVSDFFYKTGMYCTKNLNFPLS